MNLFKRDVDDDNTLQSGHTGTSGQPIGAAVVGTVGGTVGGVVTGNRQPPGQVAVPKFKFNFQPPVSAPQQQPFISYSARYK